MFVRVWMCLRAVFVTVCALAWYRTNKLAANTWAHTYSGPLLPGIMLVSVRAPQSISHSCYVWHFVCLVFLLCFLPCLGWPRLKNYTISWFDFFAKNISPTIFAFRWYCSINMLFAFFMFCYIKCCKFVLVLQNSSPALCWDTLQVLTTTNYISSVILHCFFCHVALFSGILMEWSLVSFLHSRSWCGACDGFSFTTPPYSVEWLLVRDIKNS